MNRAAVYVRRRAILCLAIIAIALAIVVDHGAPATYGLALLVVLVGLGVAFIMGSRS